ncbi:class I SAM-dependent methyltransferase [Brevundimonas sp. SL130]|uniref:class I SAM-dependent methyltransferase n=1 Tax=Brevundimonas sp. SL130 TaxID=2995143 RepID=UPI00226CC51A|nr:class I SAM-dependent methyltransferase [Brevundimonas sp. SL130]WAC59938.1 class I SAM-dependent methyltransferase [Brevundimonas sp. SL130]
MSKAAMRELPQDAIDSALALLGEDRFAETLQLLSRVAADFPAEPILHILQGVAAQAGGHRREGMEHFWRALAIAPQEAGARLAIAEATVSQPTAPTSKDFSLASGERQIAGKIADIRADHRARYAAVARWLREHMPPARLRLGLDVFCGNGYGSRMIADRAGGRVVGIDGSPEAVAMAEQYFGNHRTLFTQAIFPFTLTERLFDFAVSLESVEHVDDPVGFLRQIAQATDGPLFISVPREETLPYQTNRDLFAHHTRHFTRDEIYAVLAEIGRPVIAAEWGQTVYRLKKQRLDGLLPAEMMGLTPLEPDSQFLIAVACPAGWTSP